MKLKKILTLALVLGISFSCVNFAFAEEGVTPVTASIYSMSRDTGVSDNDHITNDNLPVFSGIAYPNQEISLYYTCTVEYEASLLGNSGCSRAFIGSTTTDEAGNWSVSTINEIPDGSWRVFYPGGPGDSPSNDFNITIDTKAPEIENAYLYNGAAMNIDFSIFDNKNVNTNNLTIAVNFLKNDFFKAKIYVWDMYNTNGSTDSSEIVNMGHSQEFNSNDVVNFYLASLNLIDSTYRVMVTSEDIAGNEIEFGLKTFTFNIDTASPEAPVIITPVSGTHDKNEPIQITGTCTPGMTVWFEPRENMAYDSVTDCLDDGTFSFTFHLNVFHDEFPGVTLPITLSARQKDGALNLSEKSNEVTLTEPIISSGGGSGGGGGAVILSTPLQNSSDKSIAIATNKDNSSGKVLGASTTCPKFTKYIKLGSKNDVDEVKMWQTFLNETQKESLTVTGEYDIKTFEAIKRFQEKYTDEVLTPWGTKSGTGYIYKTTTKKANQLLGC